MSQSVIRALLLSIALLAAGTAGAEQLREFDSPEQKARYQATLEELRCLVCQNQSLADSAASLAQDLRGQVYDMVRAGKSREEIVGYMTERYGDYVRYKPPVKNSTLLLWFGPFVAAGLGIAGLVWYLTRRNERVADSLDPESRARVNRMLERARQARKEGSQGESDDKSGD